MINILFFFVCLVAFSASHRIEGIQNTLKEDLELERRLKIINKPPVKSIHTKFGYIVDCIDINKQPAFDHPLLKNHKLQRKPSFQNINKKSAKISSTKRIFGLGKDECPTGTVPIRRTTKDELIQSQSFLTSLTTDATRENHKNHFAKTSVAKGWYKYHGVRGTNSVYNPRVTNVQASSSYMWVSSGFGDDKNKVAVGWQVFPRVYKDDKTHMFALWTRDNFKTGCLNNYLGCSAFVQVSKTNYLGGAIDTSINGGKHTVEISFSIFKDAVTDNWWVSSDDDHIGYYAASLFTNMADGGDQVGWGGLTSAPVGGLSPPMGSGQFPDKCFNHASYFRNVAFQNASAGENYGPDPIMTDSDSDNPDCYDVKYYGDKGKSFGFSLLYGGPGGNCGA